MSARVLITTIICLLCYETFAQHSRKANVVGSSISIKSTILNDDREIKIFLPDGYADSGRAYPVLYILDGQRYFLHGVSLQKSFVEFKQTPEFIVVGISKKPSDRNSNFSVNSQAYRAYIKKEVINYIDAEFRTTEKRILFGWAYGGGFTVETMITEPSLFEVYIAASPFPLEDKISRMDSLLMKNPDFNRLFYFTSGTNEGVVKDGTEELRKLLTHKAPKTMHWTFSELEGEEHRSTPFTTLYHGIQAYFRYYPELQFMSFRPSYQIGPCSV